MRVLVLRYSVNYGEKQSLEAALPRIDRYSK